MAELERERDEAVREVERLRERMSMPDMKLAARIDELEESVHLANGTAALAMKHRDEAERERDEARKDTARLDWLEGEHARERGPLDVDYERSLFRRNEPITREAIDAARQSEGE